jgi:N-acetylglutamate synthase-like GNAT family acetyltransferase
VPSPLAGKLPRYPTVPAVMIGCLARHSDYAGVGLGENLLVDVSRPLRTRPLAHAPFRRRDRRNATSFYAALGFLPLNARPGTLYLPMSTALKLL